MRRLSPLAVICVVSVAVRLGAAVMLGNTVQPEPGIYDQVSYHALALRVLGGHGFTFGEKWWPATAAGAPTAHWSYLYTLSLAGLYALAGPAPLAARLVQALLVGSLLPVLVYRLARRVLPSGEAASRWLTPPLVAAAWAGAYGYFIYYSAALVTEALYILGVLWVLDSALRLAAPAQAPAAQPPPRWPAWAELGLALGLTLLLRQVFVMFIPVLFGWLAWTWRANRRGPTSLLRGTVITCLVLAALTLPFTAYNYARFQRLVWLNTNAGFAFFWANHPIHGDQFVPILGPDQPTYGELIPSELRGLDEAALDQALMQRGLGFVLADPWRYLRLSVSRIPAYFMFWPAQASSLPSNIVRVLSFGVALPFMLLGTGLWLRAGQRGAPRRNPSLANGLLLLSFAVVYTLIHLLSWSLIRYRLPVDAVLLVFAGYGLAVTLGRLQAWRARQFHSALPGQGTS